LCGHLERRPRNPEPHSVVQKLGRAEVHLWIATSAGSPPSGESQADELSPGELAESRRFRFEVHRDRFLSARLYRRRVLAAYLGIRPRELEFGYGPKGKPTIANELAGDLSFNAAEADGLSVIAVARGRRVGVDVERLRSVPEAKGIVCGFGSPLEKEAYGHIRHEEREDWFLRWWTGKEAFVKAVGDGLSLPLATFSILVSAGGGMRLEGGGDAWSVHTLDPAPGYVGALVVEGPMPQLSVRGWGASPDEAPQ
jgi:4'-phosphopantetheinyl transferase